ncbi:MAG TPA: 7-carboxy-7-deazaguanine synthase QueE [Candidatus Omnitrophota bacterium]|nr:7-carboxy-7-deazaguanine synthase QueE [Candidatus Omnitrophota bacterium]
MNLLKGESALVAAKISEMFMSFQGEGPYAGSRQLFIRFYGCNKSCVYCDTPQKSYKTFTKDGLMGKILDFEGNYNELVLTGGEPLLYADFLSMFLSLYKRHRKNRIYLETNGTLVTGLKKVIEYVDIVAMDIKLPSSTQEPGDVWESHAEFAKISSGKELFIKMVITGNTKTDDIVRAAEVIKGVKSKISVVLQPVTPPNDSIKEPDKEMLLYFTKYLEQKTGQDIIVLGQLHKKLGIR